MLDSFWEWVYNEENNLNEREKVMFTIETMDSIFERLLNMERKHISNYYDERKMLAQEKDAKRRESLMTLLVSEQARMEALQFAEGVLMDEMKQHNLWAGSRAEKANNATRKWSREMHKKSLELE